MEETQLIQLCKKVALEWMQENQQCYDETAFMVYCLKKEELFHLLRSVKIVEIAQKCFSEEQEALYSPLSFGELLSKGQFISNYLIQRPYESLTWLNHFRLSDNNQKGILKHFAWNFTLNTNIKRSYKLEDGSEVVLKNHFLSPTLYKNTENIKQMHLIKLYESHETKRIIIKGNKINIALSLKEKGLNPCIIEEFTPFISSQAPSSDIVMRSHSFTKGKSLLVTNTETICYLSNVPIIRESENQGYRFLEKEHYVSCLSFTGPSNSQRDQIIEKLLSLFLIAMNHGHNAIVIDNFMRDYIYPLTVSCSDIINLFSGCFLEILFVDPSPFESVGYITETFQETPLFNITPLPTNFVCHLIDNFPESEMKIPYEIFDGELYHTSSIILNNRNIRRRISEMDIEDDSSPEYQTIKRIKFFNPNDLEQLVSSNSNIKFISLYPEKERPRNFGGQGIWMYSLVTTQDYWYPYDPQTTSEIEIAYRNNFARANYECAGKKYCIIFSQMKQYTIVNGDISPSSVRSVRRM
jgi:hypothetical protein